MEKMQLALLENQDPRASLDHHTGKDLSLRVFLTLSLMKRWQLTTARVQTALPSNLATTQLRQLGLRESKVDSDILVGDELGVIQHGETWLIGGEKTKQESFLQDLSAIFTLTTTQQLEHNKPMIFQDKILELNQADRTISLYLPNAFYSNLVSRYSLEEEEATSTPTQKLDKRPPRSQSTSLDGQRSQLYKQTVEELLWSSNLRPDTSFAVNQLSQSFMHPTERDEEQLRSLLTVHACNPTSLCELGGTKKMEEGKAAWIACFLDILVRRLSVHNLCLLVFYGNALCNFHDHTSNIKSNSRACFSEVSYQLSFPHQKPATRPSACRTFVIQGAYKRASYSKAWSLQEAPTHRAFESAWSVSTQQGSATAKPCRTADQHSWSLCFA